MIQVSVRASADLRLAHRIETLLPDVRSVADWVGEGKARNATLQTAVALLEEAAARLTLRANP